MRGCAPSEHLLKQWTQEALPGGSCRPNPTGTDIDSQIAISSSSSPHRSTPFGSAPPKSRTRKGASPERYSATDSQPPDARTASWALATRRTILDISPSRSWGRKRGPAWWAGFATQRRTICDTPPKARSSTHSHTSSAWRVSSPGGVAQSVRQEAEPDHCAGPRDDTALAALATTRQSRNGASSPFGRSPNKGKTDGAHERDARGAPASWGRKKGIPAPLASRTRLHRRRPDPADTG